MKIFISLSALLLLISASCTLEEKTADAYGNFETTDVIISAEATGKLLQFDVEEGEILKAGQLVGIVDTTQLYLKKLQLEASIRAVGGKTQDARPEVEVLETQKKNLLREERRIQSLLKDNAATQKQLDDIEGEIEFVERQINAATANTSTLNRGILSEIEPLRVQIRLIEDQIQKSYIFNPIEGTVLLKLAEPEEFTAIGKPLYKIANLKEMTLRAYVSGIQLSQIKIGQEVTVLIDAPENSSKSMKGTISWISSQAEFTPKIVQTKEERVNLVYAVKILVKNDDGSLKIGMPGEVVF